MGYDTTYNLSWDEEKGPSREEVAAAMAEIAEGATPGQSDFERQRNAWAEILDGDPAVRWYQNEQDMRRLSVRWPGTIFTLDKDGELGDRSRDYHQNGLMQEVPGETWYPPFDPSKLG